MAWTAQHDGIVYRNVLASYAHLRNRRGIGLGRAVRRLCPRSKMAVAKTNRPMADTANHQVNGQPVATDVEGYLKNLDDWSEDFARAEAKRKIWI